MWSKNKKDEDRDSQLTEIIQEEHKVYKKAEVMTFDMTNEDEI